MDLETLRNELSRLTALVDGWSSSENIPAVERELVLEKLRRLYETLRFGETRSMRSELAPAAEKSKPVVESPVKPMEPAVVESPVQPEVSVATATPAMDLHDMPSVEEPMPELAESVATSEPMPEPVEETPVSMPEVEPVVEPAPAVEPAPIAEPAPTVEKESAAVAEAPKEQPQPVTPSLFGADTDEEMLRHRHKQRVIMSLYNTPAPSKSNSWSAPKTDEEDENPFEEISLDDELIEALPEQDTVAQEPVTESPAAEREVEPLDESFDTPMTTVPLTDDSDEPAPTPEPEPAPAFEPVSEPVASAEEEPQVLGEVITPHRKTLADTIVHPQDVASRLRQQEPIADLKHAVGLNDKFLMIHDLFGGDGEAYEQTLDTLNGYASLDDCMIYIAENFAWNPNSDGAKLLMDLLERKFA